MTESGQHTIHFPDNIEAADIGYIRPLQVGVFKPGGSSRRVTEVKFREDGWHITRMSGSSWNFGGDPGLTIRR
jgi:hypothetical protein